MGNSFRKIFDRMFGNKEMRVSYPSFRVMLAGVVYLVILTAIPGLAGRNAGS
jgi:hypothetical protein